MILTPGRGGVVFARSADGTFPIGRLVQTGIIFGSLPQMPA